MNIKKLFKFSDENEIKPKTSNTSTPNSTDNFSTELPILGERTSNSEYVDFSDPNYVKSLMNLLDNSSMHSRIVKNKSNLIAGHDFLIDGVERSEWIKTADPNQALILSTFLNNAYQFENWFDIKSKISLDLIISGMYYIEVIWNSSFSSIQAVKYIPWMNIRPVEKNPDGEITHYVYSENFSDRNKPQVKIQSFDINAHQPDGVDNSQKDENGLTELDKYYYEHNQILSVKNHWPGLEYFGRPSYYGGRLDIQTNASISLYNLNSIENGFSPSVIATIPTPESEEEKEKTAKGMFRQFAGNLKRKLAIIFYDNPDNKPEFHPIDVRNISDQYNALKQSTDQSILTAHGVTDPQMFGVSTQGALGNADADISWSIFYNDVILTDKKLLEKSINDLIQINGFIHKIELETKKPFDTKNSENK